MEGLKIWGSPQIAIQGLWKTKLLLLILPKAGRGLPPSALYWPPDPHPVPTALNIMPKDDFWGRQSASMQKKDILNKYSAWRHASFLLLPILFTKKPNIFWNRLLVPKSFFQAYVSCFIEKFVFGFFVKPRPYDSQNTNSQSFWTLILLLVVCSFQS